MKSAACWAFAAVIGLGIIATVRSEDKTTKPSSALAFDNMKKLVGDWVAVKDDGTPDDTVVSSYKLIAAKSVLHETLFPGKPHEMVSVYHMDGPDLICTHYCAMGNQPRLKLQTGNDPKVLVFKSVSIGNSKSMNDAHMGFATITLTDDNHFTADWKSLVNQKIDESHAGIFKLVRKAK
jgi:hypothetical protein